MDKLKTFLTLHKTTVILVVTLGMLGILGWLGFQNFSANNDVDVEEVDLIFDAEGPYALLYPRRDGNALVLNIKRTSSYDAISFELAYTSSSEEVSMEGSKVRGDLGDQGDSGNLGVIDRGVSGTIDTKDKKGEYEQDILFGTCSKNVCKYDKGVENGILTLHIKKGNKAYKMITQWHLQKPDVALGVLTSGDNHFIYKVDAGREALNAIGFSIVNDLTGLPKLPSGKHVTGKVYALNVPIAKELKSGEIIYELAEDPEADAKIYRYSESSSSWEELETKVNGSKLSGKASGAGIFAILTSK